MELSPSTRARLGELAQIYRAQHPDWTSDERGKAVLASLTADQGREVASGILGELTVLGLVARALGDVPNDKALGVFVMDELPRLWVAVREELGL